MATTPPATAPVPFPAVAVAWGDNENEGVNVKLLGPADMFEMSDLFEGWFAVRMVNDQAELIAFLAIQQQAYALATGEDDTPPEDDPEALRELADGIAPETEENH